MNRAVAECFVFGLILAFHKGYLIQALTLHKPVYTIGIGMWLALIMAFNVWFIIWPNQKKVLGLVNLKKRLRRRSLPT